MKWRHREDFNDAPHGAINPKKSITDLEEHIICEIRKTTLLPLDDLLDVVIGLGIKISRSALNRALKRNDISNLTKYLKMINDYDKTKHMEFKHYEAYFFILILNIYPK